MILLSESQKGSKFTSFLNGGGKGNEFLQPVACSLKLAAYFGGSFVSGALFSIIFNPT